MDISILKQTGQSLVAPGKGILAADESTKTIQKRFDKIGIKSTPETNLAYRYMLFSTPGVSEYISGVILYDETLRQSTPDGLTVPEFLESKGILPGIKVDKGVIKLPNFGEEKITEGLDGLRDRLTEYKALGAKFAKWRAVITIGEGLPAGRQGIPTETCIKANAEALATSAALLQEQDIVPIVEPEVLMDGSHSLKRCQEVTAQTLKVVFEQLKINNVLLEGMLLKPNMVISGKEAATKATAAEIAEATIKTFKQVVPVEVPGIVFLSGGQSPDEATAILAAINKLGPADAGWQLSYSYGRALQDEALKAWAGKEENIKSAQQAFLERAQKVSSARSVNPV